MKQIILKFSRLLLCVLTLCASLVLTGCGGGPKTSDPNDATNATKNSFGGVTLTASLSDLTETGVVFYGEVVLAENYTAESFGILYSTEKNMTASSATVLPIVDIYGTDFSVSTTSLKPETTYYYASYIKQGTIYKYSEVKTFTTEDLSVPILDGVSELTEGSAVISGKVILVSGTSSDLEYGFQYCQNESFSSGVTTNEITFIDSDNKFSVPISYLAPKTVYYYRSYTRLNGVYVYGEVKSFTTLEHPYNIQTDLNLSSAVNLSFSGSANCYIVSNGGLYKFKTVKGNSSESVGNVVSASILWETFGTSEAPELFALVKAFCYKDGYIAFQTADSFKEGNAVIAAKDANGNILWSWHIWFTDQPKGQVYYNNAGTMMDRNLGATSATPGAVGALGLLYQWGRKDPFLGSSSISSSIEAASTIAWPSAVSSNSSNGTIAYATANPTTFITSNDDNYDWYYTGSSSTDNTRWTESSSPKSIYDPCPAGWRVPDGGSNGVWSKALGSWEYFDYTYNSTNRGMNFSRKFGADQTIWYPAPGFRHHCLYSLFFVCVGGHYWSASPDGYDTKCAYYLSTGGYGVHPSPSSIRAHGQSVRCLQE